MIFASRSNVQSIFAPSVGRVVGLNTNGFDATTAALKTPDFLVERESIFSGVGPALKVVFAKSIPFSRRNGYPLQKALLRRTKKNRIPVSFSAVLHAALLLSLIYLPTYIRASEPDLDAREIQPEKIYYQIPLHKAPKLLPRIAPQGAGSAPGNGPFAVSVPALGSTAAAHNLTVVSKPKVPDNFKQTIIQPNSPPDLKIKTDQKLPNIILGNQPAAPKPKIDLDAIDTKPKEFVRKITNEAAPAMISQNPDPNIPALNQVPTAKPSLPTAFGALAHPAVAQGKYDNVTASDARVAMPGDGSGLTVLGVDPSDPSVQLGLPPGNRLGAFTISDAGGQPGSPGGNAHSSVPGGNGSEGAGGNGAVGVGAGFSGGGGGKNGAPGNLSVNNGEGGRAGEPTMMPTGSANDLVYPVAVATANAVVLRKSAIVVSAGPIGGGGTDVYRALTCGKIDTVFLPMPGKNWSMQYCQHGGTARQAKDTYAAVVHMETSLTPPDPELQTRFDFKRLPVPIDKARKMIVLKGVMKEDGTLENIEVYQGVLAPMDSAAKDALSHWKFKPAIRDGKPVAIDFLVGIPAEIVSTRPVR